MKFVLIFDNIFKDFVWDKEKQRDRVRELQFLIKNTEYFYKLVATVACLFVHHLKISSKYLMARGGQARQMEQLTWLW